MNRRWTALAIGALLVATAAVYLPAVDGEFLLDDDTMLADPLVHSLGARGPEDWLGAARPLTTFTFALNHAAVGSDPRGWHLTNLAIHLCVALLAWAFARRTLARAGMAAPDAPALLAAALFALHPLQTESVAYVSQRAESLASGLLLLGLVILLAHDGERTAARRWALLSAAAFVQILGMLTKEIAALLPAAWLLHAAIIPGAGDPPEGGAAARVRRRLLPAVPLLLLSAAFAARSLAAVQGSVHAGFGVPDLSPARYLATQLRVVPTYLRLSVWPTGQCADWWFPASEGFLEPRVIAGALFLAAIVAGAVVLALRAAKAPGEAGEARAVSFGILFFFLGLTPSSSVIPLIDPLAEHRVYLGVLGLAIAAAAAGRWAVRRFLPRRAVVAAWVAAAALLVALATATALRAAAWNSRLELWTDAAEKAPRKARVQLNLGTALFFRQRFGEAAVAFRRAKALADDHTVTRDDVILNLVGALTALGRVDEARGELDEELRRSPRSTVALGLLAQVEYVAGRTAHAEVAARRALSGDPGNPQALKYLGRISSERGDLLSARDLLRSATMAQPLDTSLYLDLGNVDVRLRDLRSACANFRRAATDPRSPWVASKARESYRTNGCK